MHYGSGPLPRAAPPLRLPPQLPIMIPPRHTRRGSEAEGGPLGGVEFDEARVSR